MNVSRCNLCDRHEDLKQMLDSNKDNLKLEAMKRIIGVSVCICFGTFGTSIITLYIEYCSSFVQLYFLFL